MKPRIVSLRVLYVAGKARVANNLCQQRRYFNAFFRKVESSSARASNNGGSVGSSGSSSSTQGNALFIPGATMATILMLGTLHARRIYNDRKIEEAREKGIELEFHPDVKATFLQFLPLRTISRCWGFLTSLEYPVWMRPHVYRAWAQAFHSNLEEAALPLEEYASLREFFVRKLKEGSRPIDSDPHCLISPVDGTVLRFGELKPGAMIEQVKGFSYSVSSLLGARQFLPVTNGPSIEPENGGEEHSNKEAAQKSHWSVSLASPRIRDQEPACSMKGLFYCVIYLKPGDYHWIHSPVDWNVHVRRHFSGRLFPLNERAARTIRNLYVENERVVLEGHWKEGYLAMAAVGATTLGSIELFIEPTVRTNRPMKKFLQSPPPDEKIYGPEGTGITLKKGDEIAVFNAGSTVVLIFQAPTPSTNDGLPSNFRFSVKRGDRIRMGEALGRLEDA